MTSGACKLVPGHLNTREERRRMRLLAGDLERQISRTSDPSERERLEQQLAGIRREQAYDKQVSPRSKKARKGGKERR